MLNRQNINIKDMDENSFFLKDDDSWIMQTIIRRLAWVAVGIGAILILPIGFCKSVYLLCTLQPLAAIKTLFSILLVAVVLTVFAAVNVIMPSLGNRFIAYMLIPARLQSPSLPDYSKQVKTPKGVIDTPYIWAEESEKYIIQFRGNGEVYQYMDSKKRECDEKNLNRSIRVFNYPDVSGSYSSTSSNDLVNAGIAVIFYLIKEKKWSNQQVAENLQLYGYSLGGGIALQAAKCFKKYNIDIPIFVDRSFRSMSAMSAGILHKFGVPLWYGRRLSALSLSAGGGFELDSVAACKALNPAMITYINLGHAEEYPGYQVKPWWRRLLGYWIDKHEHADPVIFDGATLAEGIEEELVMPLPALDEKKSEKWRGRKTSFIYSALNRERRDHLVFGNAAKFPGNQLNDHRVGIAELKAADGTRGNEIYKNIVTARDTSTVSKMGFP